MGFITWIIFGALAGWLASKITGNDANMGAIANIVVGIVGALIGGYIGNNFLGTGGVDGFNFTSLLIAIGGAVILLLIVGLFTKKDRNNTKE